MLFSNCCSLEILKLECPRLTSLFLQVCAFLTFNEFLDLVVVWVTPIIFKGKRKKNSLSLSRIMKDLAQIMWLFLLPFNSSACFYLGLGMSSIWYYSY